MTVEILKPPAYAPWQGMTEWARDVVRTAVSTETNFSTTLVTATLFRVPANTVVLSAGMIISSTIDAGSSDVLLTLGDSDDADALLSVEISSLTLVNVGAALAKEYTSAQDIIATFTTGTDSKVGAVKFWITFKTDLDKVNTYNY
jgi:hypothetical protein